MNLTPARQKRVLAALLVAASTFVLYGGALNNDFISWDDEYYVLANPYITPLSGANIGNMFSHFYFKSWTPLTLLVHAADYSLWGLDPRGHHLTNMVIHALNGVWMFILSVVLLKRYRRRNGTGPGENDATPLESAVIAGGVASALMFAWHPLRVESVACASSLKDLLGAFFALPSLLLYLVYSGRRGSAGAWRPYAGSIVLFCLALLAKGSVMTLAGLLLIIDLVTEGFGGGLPRWLRLTAEKVPYLVLGLAAAVVSYIASDAGGDMVQALRAKSEFSSGELGLYNLSFYLLKTLWPGSLAELYTYPKWGAFLTFSMTAPLVTLMCAFLWWKGYRAWLYAWSAYIVAIIPMAGFVPSSIQSIANRYAYFAAAPFCILFGGGIFSGWIRARGSPGRWALVALMIPASLCLLALGAKTALHVGDWRDAETIWRHTIAVSPGHALAHNELGLALLEKKDYPGAIASFKRSIEIFPEFATAMCNLGGAYVSIGDTAAAERVLRRSLSLAPRDYATFTNLGNVRMVEMRYADAAEFYRESLSINPAAAVTTYNLGCARMLLGDPEEALVHLRRAAQLNPNYREAYYMIGEILLKQKGAGEEALAAYRRAARLGHEQSQRILAARGLDW